MLLRIIDKPSYDRESRLIEIVFVSDGLSKSFETEHRPGAFSGSLKKDLAWYFADYMDPVHDKEGDRSVIDRLISHGKYMGDRLVGDNLQLISYREAIEDYGYSNLSVSVESGAISFFEEPWETLILPDSNYVLSSVANGFTRCFGDVSSDRPDAVIEYESNRESPLRLVHAICVAEQTTGGNVLASTAYNAANDLLCYDGAVDYELWPLDDWSALEARLSQLSVAHIFHYQGPLVYRQGMFYLPLAHGEPGLSGQTDVTSLLDLIECLKCADCGLLLLNVTEWLCESPQTIAADTGLALAAQISINAGIPNVLGFSSVTDPWTAENCLTHVYRNLLRGLSVAQSVVEARKALQGQTESSHLSFSPLPFQSWPLLVHYELQPVRFCSVAQPEVELSQAGAYANVRLKMHGFFDEYLPPNAKVSGNSVLLQCLRACRSEGGVIINIHGGQGSGRTQILHMLAFYLVHRSVHQAFYFNYAEYFYTAGDIREMIEPVLSADIEGKQVNDTEDRNIFMLDNFESAYQSADKPGREALAQYLNELAAARNFVVVTGGGPLIDFPDRCSGQLIEIALWPLNKLEQRNMASLWLKEQNFEVKEYRQAAAALLQGCNGNPFLIRNVMAQLSTAPEAALIDRVDKLFGGENPADCVDRFYSWQWHELDITWRRLLHLLTDLRGVLLEMLAVICDSKNRFDAVSELFDVVGEPDMSFGEGIGVIEKAGFATRHRLGRVISPRGIRFIKRQNDDEIIAGRRPQLSLLLSRIVCRSLVVIVPEVTRKSDQLLIQNLIANRGQWAAHLENVWRAGKYEEFSATLSALSELLNQPSLVGELAQWALHVLSGSDGLDLNSDGFSPASLKSHIKLVAIALAAKDATQNKIVRNTAVFCNKWLNTIDEGEIEQQAALFTSITKFLQIYYRKEQQWDLLQSVCEIALQQYKRHEVWPLVVSTLNLLIECCSETGDTAQAKLFEGQLLDDIPLDSLSTGIKWQLETNVVANRTARGEYAAAQELLDQIYDSTDGGYQRQLLDILQADIYFRQEKLKEAAQLYNALFLVILLQFFG